MKSFNEIKKELKENNIFVVKMNATINGVQAYKLRGVEHNPAAIWTAEEIKNTYYNGEFF